MAIQDCMKLIDDINKLSEKTNLCPTKLAHINAVFWCSPVLPIHIVAHAELVINLVNPCVSTIISASNMQLSGEN